MVVPVAAAAAPAALASLGSLMGGAGSLLGGLSSFMPSSQTTSGSTSKSGTSTTQRVLSDEAINKLIYDVLASDQGLANLASGENLSGGFNSSAKTLQAQDFMTKLIGELAVATAPTVTESEEQATQTQTSKKKATVICTELARQGLLSPELYEAGGPASKQVHRTTWIGYHCWAVHVVSKMQKSERLSRALLPIVQSRYLYLTKAPGIHLLGRLSVWVGHPICYAIGTVINWSGGYGRASEFA